MEQSNAKLNIRELLKGVDLNSLSIHVTFIKITIHITIICGKISLKRCQNRLIKNRIPRCKLDRHFTPLCKF